MEFDGFCAVHHWAEATARVLVSFNVILLFTNVPTELAINVACRWLLEDETLKDMTFLTVGHIIMLLQLCLDATYMSFQGYYYRQSFGTAMGSPVSVTAANLVTEEIEESSLTSFHPPPTSGKDMWMTHVRLFQQTLCPAQQCERSHLVHGGEVEGWHPSFSGCSSNPRFGWHIQDFCLL